MLILERLLLSLELLKREQACYDRGVNVRSSIVFIYMRLYTGQ